MFSSERHSGLRSALVGTNPTLVPNNDGEQRQGWGSIALLNFHRTKFLWLKS